MTWELCLKSRLLKIVKCNTRLWSGFVGMQWTNGLQKNRGTLVGLPQRRSSGSAADDSQTNTRLNTNPCGAGCGGGPLRRRLGVSNRGLISKASSLGCAGLPEESSTSGSCYILRNLNGDWCLSPSMTRRGNGWPMGGFPLRPTAT
jgi:hypothetical protein